MKYIIIFLLISTNLFGQTNYNTILNTQKDSIPEIDLHLKKSDQISTAASLSHLATLISMASLYYIAPVKTSAFLIPVGFFATSIGCHIWSGYEYKKSKEYLESEK